MAHTKLDTSGIRAVDAIIIGSGFGGSMAAHRLSQSGKKIIVLERGPWRDSEPVRSHGVDERAPFPYGAQFYTHGFRTLHFEWGPKNGITLNKKGFFELFRSPGLDVLCTSGVGGGSHAYTAMLTKPESPTYWNGHHSDLTPRKIEQHYDQLLADMGAVPWSEHTPAPNSVWSQLQGLPLARCAPAENQSRVAMRLPRELPWNDGGVFGSRRGTKPSVDVVYLLAAMKQGLEVEDLCEVEHVRRLEGNGAGGNATAFEARYRDHRSGRSELVRAPVVIVAAGTINTLRILFRSRDQSGLRGMPALGTRFGGNGDFLGLWFRTDRDPDVFNATPSLGRFAVDGASTPYMVLFGLPGLDQLALPKRLVRWLSSRVPVVGMGADSGCGSVTSHNGKLRIRYDNEAESVYDEIKAVFDVLEKESGMKIAYGQKPMTVHQWGGAHLGPDEHHGVVDHTGEVYGNPGLYIADGSALPAAVGTPPSLTIAAWAHHVADCVMEKHFGRRAQHEIQSTVGTSQ
ncbi:MAG: GMC oxidoreductase [Polyangiales bacterium]